MSNRTNGGPATGDVTDPLDGPTAPRVHGPDEGRSPSRRPASKEAAACITFDFPDELVDAIAARAAELAVARLGLEPERWVGVEAAAEHLACPTSRIYALASKRAIPHCKEGSRLLFRCSELDRFVEEGGATR